MKNLRRFLETNDLISFFVYSWPEKNYKRKRVTEGRLFPETNKHVSCTIVANDPDYRSRGR